MGDPFRMRKRALRLLEHWAEAAEAVWYPLGDTGDTGCYGPGYRTWGVQSNWNYAGVMATLARYADLRDQVRWRERSVAALRFALATHVTGDRPGNDGLTWGRSWIGMLGIERAMHGLASLIPQLSDTDRDALRRVLTDEADWVFRDGSRGRFRGVTAGQWAADGRNCPESNIWMGCFLWHFAARLAVSSSDRLVADAAEVRICCAAEPAQ